MPNYLFLHLENALNAFIWTSWIGLVLVLAVWVAFLGVIHLGFFLFLVVVEPHFLDCVLSQLQKILDDTMNVIAVAVMLVLVMVWFCIDRKDAKTPAPPVQAEDSQENQTPAPPVQGEDSQENLGWADINVRNKSKAIRMWKDTTKRKMVHEWISMISALHLFLQKQIDKIKNQKIDNEIKREAFHAWKDHFHAWQDQVRPKPKWLKPDRAWMQATNPAC